MTIDRLFDLFGAPRVPPVAGGYRRAWARCKCGRHGFRDYVPYSLSDPMMWCLGCGCDWRKAATVSELRGSLGLLIFCIRNGVRKQKEPTS